MRTYRGGNKAEDNVSGVRTAAEHNKRLDESKATMAQQAQAITGSTQPGPGVEGRLAGQNRTAKQIMDDLQKTRNKPNLRKEGGRKTRKKGNKSMKRRC